MGGNTDYLAMVRRSPMNFKIQKVAVALFHLYQEVLQKDQFVLVIDEDPELWGHDLEQSFALALRALFEEKKNKRSIFGWAEGFVLGFIASHIRITWHTRYVYCKREEYKQIMLLKALITYIEFNPATTEALLAIHRYLTEASIEPQDHLYGEQYKIISRKIVELRNGEEVVNDKFRKRLLSYLTSLLLQEHDALFQRLLPQPDALNVESLISYEEALKLILFCEEQLMTCSNEEIDLDRSETSHDSTIITNLESWMT